MSRDLDLEGDSPDSSIHLDNVDIEELNNDIFQKRQTRAMNLNALKHKSESTHSLLSVLPTSANESVKEVSEIRTQRTTDLVRQPIRWWG